MPNEKNSAKQTGKQIRMSGTPKPIRSIEREPTPLKHLEESWTLNADALEYVHRAAERGLYEIRGLGAKLATFDDLVFLTASLSRYPLEGYREKCTTKTVLGTRFAKKPTERLDPAVTQRIIPKDRMIIDTKHVLY
jgi:hypothetical protein